MATKTERDANQSAYRRLKPTIDQQYAAGRFVAIREGCIVADAASFSELEDALQAAGFPNRDALVVQAGVEYPETAVIFASRRRNGFGAARLDVEQVELCQSQEFWDLITRRRNEPAMSREELERWQADRE